MKDYRTVERKRTIQDKLISGINSLRYTLTEPVMLKIARLYYAHLYNDLQENPLISVYIPTYNRASTIEGALQSLCGRTDAWP